MDCRDDVLELPISCRDPLPYQSTAASQNPGSALALAVTGESVPSPHPTSTLSSCCCCTGVAHRSSSPFPGGKSSIPGVFQEFQNSILRCALCSSFP